jgi:hypothetical protein
MEQHITPPSKISLGLKELWQYKELFYLFTPTQHRNLYFNKNQFSRFSFYVGRHLTSANIQKKVIDLTWRDVKVSTSKLFGLCPGYNITGSKFYHFFNSPTGRNFGRVQTFIVLFHHLSGFIG